MSKFSIGTMLYNNRDAAVVVVGNDVVRLNSLLVASGHEDLPGGFGLSEMLDHWDVWLPRLKSVVGAFEKDVSIRNGCEIAAVSDVTWLPPIQRPRKLICTTIASMCAESFVLQKLPVPTGSANRLLPAAAFVHRAQKSKPGRIQS